MDGVDFDADDGNDTVVLGDLQYFDIDKATGQITVKKKGKGLTFENDRDGEYTLVVRATDPSGEGDDENRDDIVVTVALTDVNEAPDVDGMSELWVNEDDSTRDIPFMGLQYRVDPETGLYLQEDQAECRH